MRKTLTIEWALADILCTDVQLPVLARGTPGFTGADLSNLVNVAAIQAAVENSDKVYMRHFEFAKDRIMMGSERKSAVMTPEVHAPTNEHLTVRL